MPDTLTFTFGHEPTMSAGGRAYVVCGEIICRATCTVHDDGEDFDIHTLEIEGVDVERPTAGNPKATRFEHWFPVTDATPFREQLWAAAWKAAPDEISAAIDAGDIGPAARRAALADYLNDLAKEAAE